MCAAGPIVSHLHRIRASPRLLFLVLLLVLLLRRSHHLCCPLTLLVDRLFCVFFFPAPSPFLFLSSLLPLF